MSKGFQYLAPTRPRDDSNFSIFSMPVPQKNRSTGVPQKLKNHLRVLHSLSVVAVVARALVMEEGREEEVDLVGA